MTHLFMFFFSEYYSDYECNTPLLYKAVLSATSSMNERGPGNAILYGKLKNKLQEVIFHFETFVTS